MFAMVELSEISKLDLTGAQWRVFWQVAAAVNKETGIAAIRTQQIAADIDAIPQNVSRELSALRRRHVLIAEGPGQWRINSNLAWRGELKDWENHFADDREPRWSKS